MTGNEIIYFEIDNRPTPQRFYCSWRRIGTSEFWSETSYSDAPVRKKSTIPDDVRIALALLVAPGLVCPAGEKKGD